MRWTPTLAMDRLTSEQALKKGILLALLVHLFFLVAIPAYSVKATTWPPPEIIIEKLPEFSLPPPKDHAPAARRPAELEEAANVPDDTTIEPTILDRDTPEPVAPPPPLAQNPSRFVYVFHETEPELYRHLVPEYPDIMRTAGLQDTVVVLLFVDATGVVTDHEFTRGEEAFRKAVRAVIPTLRFHPATANDRKVGVWISQTFAFRLEDR